MSWFRRRRKVSVYPMSDGRWSASTSINGSGVWETRDSAVEAVEALRLYLMERQILPNRTSIEVDW